MDRAEHDRIGALIAAENEMMDRIREKFTQKYGAEWADDLKKLVSDAVQEHLLEMRRKGLLKYTEVRIDE